MGEDLSCYSNKIWPVSLRKFPRQTKLRRYHVKSFTSLIKFYLQWYMTIRRISRNNKCDVIHKTGSASPIATPPEENRATAIVNVCKNGKDKDRTILSSKVKYVISATVISGDLILPLSHYAYFIWKKIQWSVGVNKLPPPKAFWQYFPNYWKFSAKKLFSDSPRRKLIGNPMLEVEPSGQSGHTATGSGQNARWHIFPQPSCLRRRSDRVDLDWCASVLVCVECWMRSSIRPGLRK